MNAELPQGWTRVSLRTLVGEGVFADGDWVESKDQDPNGEVRLIQLADVGVGRFVDKSFRFLTEKKAVELGCTFLEPGDVLISRMADPIGRACIFPGTKQRCVTVVDVCIVRPHAARAEARWLTASINSPQFRGAIELAASGTTRSRVSRSNLGVLEIPVPPLNEQRRIVAKLESLQSRSRRAREALEAVPPLLEKLRQSILAAAFRGDLTKDWRAKHKDVEPASELLKRIRIERRKKWEEAELAKMKAKGKIPTDDKWKEKYKEPTPVDTSGLPELPRGWCWGSLGELAHIGTGATPKRGEDKYYLGGNIAWVTSGALNDDHVVNATELVTECAVAETNLTLYPPGTLLLAMYGEGKTRGMVSELRIEATTNQAIAAICLDGAAIETKGLVRLALASNYAEIRRASMGGVQPNLNLEKVRALTVPLCPADEASVLEAIVRTALDQANGIASNLALQSGALETMNRSVLAKAFRGELVPQDPSDEPAEVMLARVRNTESVETRSVGKKRASGAKDIKHA